MASVHSRASVTHTARVAASGSLRKTASLEHQLWRSAARRLYASDLSGRLHPRFPQGRQDVLRLLGGHSREHTITNRAGLITWKPKLDKPMQRVCTKPFRFMNINWKGDAIVCCNDFYGAHPLGNVNTDSVVALWNSPAMNDYRLKLQDGDRSMELCANCDFPGGPYLHNIQRITRSGIVSQT